MGLALRDIESDELDRGFVCSTDPGIKMSDSYHGKVQYNKYWKNAVKEGMMLHVGHWMQILPVRVVLAGADKDSEVTFELDGKMIHKSGDKGVQRALRGLLGLILLSIRGRIPLYPRAGSPRLRK